MQTSIGNLLRIFFTYRYIKRLISPFIFTIIRLMHSSCRFSPFFNCRQSFIRLLNQNKFITCFNFFLFISKSIGMPFFGQFPISGFNFFLGYSSFQIKSFQCMFFTQRVQTILPTNVIPNAVAMGASKSARSKRLRPFKSSGPGILIKTS